jgi:type I restriction enzyme, R subunit
MGLSSVFVTIPSPSRLAHRANDCLRAGVDVHVLTGPAVNLPLSENVAGLPTELPAEDEEAKRFDLLMLRLQLALLRAEPGFAKLRDQVRSIAEALEDQASIPMVRDRLELIQEIQTDEYWQDVTAPMLEIARKRLRDIIKLMEKSKKKRVYTDFDDEIGVGAEIEIVATISEIDFERFKAKVQHFLKAHKDHIVIHKLRRNQPLTGMDLEELEKILVKAAGAPSPHIAAVKEHGLGLFIRSLVGLDREAAKEAFASFINGKRLSANQIEFINLIIDHLTEHGVIEAERLYESPFTDLNPRGVEGLFDTALRCMGLSSVFVTIPSPSRLAHRANDCLRAGVDVHVLTGPAVNLPPNSTKSEPSARPSC